MISLLHNFSWIILLTGQLQLKARKVHLKTSIASISFFQTTPKLSARKNRKQSAIIDDILLSREKKKCTKNSVFISKFYLFVSKNWKVIHRCI